MAGIMRQGERVLENTLDHLSRLYRSNNVQPGRMVRAGIKKHWVMVTGSEGECGIACNGTGALPDEETRAGSHAIGRVRLRINRPLFEVAATGIQSDDPADRSVGLAAMSALSQHFLSCTSVRKRGFFSECWRAGDPFILQNPMMSRFVTMDDTVAVIGNGAGLGLRELRGMCRELHVMDTGSPDMFGTIIIGTDTADKPRDNVFHTGEENPGILHTADIVFINAARLLDPAFPALVRDASPARMVGLYGLSGSIIPDAFFHQGLDFISSFRVTDPCGFSDAMAKEHDIESAFRTEQKQYLMMKPGSIP